MTSASFVRTDLTKTILILTVLSLARLAFSFTFELVPQEAYYFFYSKHLALSYFDHPPVLAYLLRLFTLLFGERAAALRIAAFTVTLLTQWAWLTLARKFVGTTNEVSKAVILFNSTGMVSVLSFIATPDLPLMLFWTLTLLAFHSDIFEDRSLYWV